MNTKIKKSRIVICIVAIILILLFLVYAVLTFTSKDGYYDYYNNSIVYPEIPHYAFFDGHSDPTEKAAEEYKQEMYIGKSNSDFLISDYNGGVCINAYIGDSKDVVIPEYIDGKKVYKLGINYTEKQYDYDLNNLADAGAIPVHGVFDDCDIETVFLPATLKEISANTFIKVSITGRKIFHPTTLKEINVDANNPYYVSYGGMLFNKHPFKLLCAPRVGYFIELGFIGGIYFNFDYSENQETAH